MKILASFAALTGQTVNKENAPDSQNQLPVLLGNSLTGREELIEQGGGSVAKIEYWGLRNLTYRIKKNRKGHYSLLAIDAPAGAVKEMERQLSINEDVLRYMTVRVDELDLELSPILARRDRDRDRPRDDSFQA